MGIDPIDHRLMMHSQMTRDAAKVHAIHIQPHSLLSPFVAVTGFLWLGCVASLAVLAFVALALPR
jgi:hypothetical protein